ncbi:MAG TPA: hypothetical protein VJ024_01905 [Thermodesulfovibrionales bacterium]|nr:hypothetical protein [Thermodesulfovibrionales bacterium]
MVRLEEIKELYNFEPKYNFSQLQQNLPLRFGSQIRIHDSRCHKAVGELTGKAYPTEESAYEKRWSDFYLPLKRKGYFILIPLTVILYDHNFFLCVLHSVIEVCKGKEKDEDEDEFYSELITQTVKFCQILRKAPGIVLKAIPYDIRTGRVLGKYILEDLFPCDKKEEILELYRNYIKKGDKSHGVSLNCYLDTAAICYRATFGGKTDGIFPEQMYRKWADGRDCGMLEIDNKKSKKAFGLWLDNKSRCGGHPFEIVFSWHEHGIHLYPPYPDRPYFSLSVTDYMYAIHFLEMVKALIKNKIPFEANDIGDVLNYLSGESYFTVNDYDKHYIFYDSGDKKLLKHIEWDEPRMLKWKFNNRKKSE